MNSDRTKHRSAESSSPAQAAPAVSSSQATRETFESIVIAVILAFLFRGFVAEAFVIPTGSMAPTLQGRHIDVECPECGYAYRAGASEENEPGQGVVVKTFCPMCQFPLPLIPPDTLASIAEEQIHPSEYQVHLMRSPNHRSFNGDRILVSKFAYELAEPERWDVIVFKYPGNAKQNYIKRLVGLPGELVRIHHGDIYIGKHLFDTLPNALPAAAASHAENAADQAVPDALRAAFAQHDITLSEGATLSQVPVENMPESHRWQTADVLWEVTDPAAHKRYVLRTIEFEDRVEAFELPEIARKPTDKQLALMHRVDDTDYRSETLTRLGWPERWQQRDAENPVWKHSDDGHFTVDGPTDELAWLRYRHVFPTTDEWEYIQQNNRLPDDLLLEEGQLITDYYAYNDRLFYGLPSHRMLGYHWVGDLAIEADVEVKSDSGQIALDLVEGGVHFRCTVDVATGKATLSRSDGLAFADTAQQESTNPSAITALKGPGTYELRFSNVDSELRLWVDDTLVAFDGPTTYERTDEVQPRWSEEDPGDLAPAGIGVQGAELDVQRLALLRDVYYIATTPSFGGEATDYSTGFRDFEDELTRVVYDGRAWQSTDLFRSRRTAEFVLGPDQFFPLGDNSPYSMDGRKWDEGPYFERDLLLGKAVFIYWPHAWRRPIPYLTINFRRMRFIH